MKKLLASILITLLSFSSLFAYENQALATQIDLIVAKMLQDEGAERLEEISGKIDVLEAGIENGSIRKFSDKNMFVIMTLADSIDQALLKLENEQKLIQEEKLSKLRASSDSRPIGTVEITAPNYSYSDSENLVYEIITTNNVVLGYELNRDLKTGEYGTESYDIEKLDIGFMDQDSGELYLAHHRFRYEYIREDLMTFAHTIRIEGDEVFYKEDKIGNFYPNQLQLFSKEDIPLTQGCTDFWSDNTTDKIFYGKDSQFYDDINDGKKYNYRFTYFCSEQDAIDAGYTRSLN